MNFYAISALINALTSASLGMVVISRDPRKPTNVTFFLFAAAITIWSIFYLFWQLATDAPTALRYVHLFMVAAVFIPFFYFHFVTLFTKAGKYHQMVAWIGYIFALGFASITYAPLFIAGVSRHLFFNFWPDPGPLFLPFLCVWIFYVIYAFALLLRAWHHVHGHYRQQLRLIVLGMFIGYFGGISNYLLWYNIPAQPVGNILVSFYVLSVGYAIVRHRLFSAKVIVTDFAVISLWMISLTRLLLSSSTREYFVNGFYLIVVAIIGIFLILSVRKEVNSREHIEQLAKKLEKANARLKELDKLKSEFVSIASHQLRSPLTAMRGYASMLLEGSYGKLPQKAIEPIERIAESSRMMASSVEDYLNVSRIESGNMKYELSDFNLRDTVEHIADDKRPEALQKGLVLIFRTDLDTQGIVYADIGKTEQIIHNLLNNALKYTPKGTVKVYMHDDVKRKQIHVDIIDSGIGLSA